MGARALLEFADDEKSGFPLDQGQDARPGLAGSQDRVAFPVPEARAVHRARRACGNRALARQSPAAVIRAIPFPLLLPRAAEMLVELSAGRFVRPEIAINRLVTDREDLLPPQPSGDLFGTPVLLHQGFDPCPI